MTIKWLKLSQINFDGTIYENMAYVLKSPDMLEYYLQKSGLS